MPEFTKEFTKCFAVFYQSDEYIKSKNFLKMIVGHGPVLVEKNTGKIFETGSVYVTEHYVTAFEITGDPFAELSSRIKIFGWEPGANKPSAVSAIYKNIGFKLKDAKLLIDNVLSGKTQVVECNDIETAEKLNDELKTNGFKSEHLWSNEC